MREVDAAADRVRPDRSHSAGQYLVGPGNVGYVFQDATLLPWRTVQRNVELFCELQGVAKAERRRAAAEAIELVGLKGFEKHYPLSLSGGMKMRGVAGPLAHAQARRCSCSTSRSAPSTRSPVTA